MKKLVFLLLFVCCSMIPLADFVRSLTEINSIFWDEAKQEISIKLGNLNIKNRIKAVIL